MLGMALIMLTSANSAGNYNHLKGIFFGLSAAALYASVVITNKSLKIFQVLRQRLFSL
jgi:hypothetical protein